MGRTVMQYDDHVKLIHKLAHRYTKRQLVKIPNLDQKDYQKELVCEGNQTFLRAFKEWEPERSKFSTYLWLNLELDFEKYNKQFFRISVREHELPEFWTGHQVALQEHRATFLSSIRVSSKEAQEIITIILSGPSELLGLLGDEPPRKVRGALKDYLRRLGWSWPKIWKSFKEVKALCR